MADDIHLRRRPETLWRMVDGQCNQLTDAVSASRTPFLLALLWAFIWSWSLYAQELGYVATFYRHRLDESLSYSAYSGQDARSSNAMQFRLDCNRVTAGSLTEQEMNGATLLTDEKKKECENALRARREWAEKAYLESATMSFPGGFPKVDESDLGIIGQLGLLLILTWQYYSVRRENHAVTSFVDVDKEGSKFVRFHLPEEFVIEPQQPDYLYAEHLCYAYHAVAQRFLLIFS